MRKKFYYFKNLLENLFATKSRPVWKDLSVKYLEKRDVVTLSNDEVEFVALEHHRMQLRQRAKNFRQDKKPLVEKPEPGNITYAVSSDRY